jgi:uncharacterized protein YecE (DUF72 family)
MPPSKIGPIGFSYPQWNGTFFPPGLPMHARLNYVSTQFTAIELDTTFYGMPRSGQATKWAKEVPDDFTISFKAPRDLTHRDAPLFLSSPEAGMLWDEFCAFLKEMGKERSVALLQFPHTFSARSRDSLLNLIERQPEIKVAVELRHESWYVTGAAQSLGVLGACVVSADRAPLGECARIPTDQCTYEPFPILRTTDWMYMRLCGRHDQYERDDLEIFDPTPRLQWWTESLAASENNPENLVMSSNSIFEPQEISSKELIITCGNSYAGHSPATLTRMMEIMGIQKPTPLQPGLFD